MVVHDRRFEEILHTPSIRKALYDGAHIIAELAYRLAIEPEYLEQIKKDHTKYRKLY